MRCRICVNRCHGAYLLRHLFGFVQRQQVEMRAEYELQVVEREQVAEAYIVRQLTECTRIVVDKGGGAGEQIVQSVAHTGLHLRHTPEADARVTLSGEQGVHVGIHARAVHGALCLEPLHGR